MKNSPSETETHNPEPLRDIASVKDYILKINNIAARDYAEYKERENEFANNPRRIILFCSDGRVDVSMFFNNPLERFRHPQLPMPGNIWIASEDFKNCDSRELLDKFYEENKKDVDQLFEYMFDEYLKADPNCIIELQSHSEAPGSYHHGCGAHKSNTANAVKETAKLAYLISRWNPKVRIVRTHNYTGQMRLVPANEVDNNALDDHGNKIGIRDLAKITLNFDPDSSILRGGNGENHFGIDIDNHAEQTILISNTPLAHHGGGRQALRMAWNTDPQFMFNFIRILMGIIKSNYLQKNPDAPIILHFDLPDGQNQIHEDGGVTNINSNILLIRGRILDLMHKDYQIQTMLEQGRLLVITTLTDPRTYKTKIYQ